MKNKGYIAAIGGANVDIAARAFQGPVWGDSNQGSVRLSPGGVCRNIAHNLALLGHRVEMLTAFGNDRFAEMIMAFNTSVGIDMTRTVTFSEASTSTYCYLSKPDGEMLIAVSDMEIYNLLSPVLLKSNLEWLKSADAVILDTNLTEESICWICSHAKSPVFADPVSAAKSIRLLPSLTKIHTLKPNRLEAEALTGVKITDEASLNRAMDILLSSGIKNVFLTLGHEGLLAADCNSRIMLYYRGEIPVNTTGCGDAFAAALVWAAFRECSIALAATAGMAASAIAMSGYDTVNSKMSEKILMDEIEKQKAYQEEIK